ncbi:MAG: SDR family NAD(P)-dependent oxidoreductase [Alphaproteobacteria bacterium]|nr:SDR family NAD(P)-dependent oxidoreductase [Alphaproteobacteria bacterium]MBV8412221.1 SDR family NAD(P)-dependent oxidoreductase [Alphaproteobacteria bacterium]
MRIVVIGATSTIAEHCCRLWVARQACDLVLVARNAAKAGRVAADLQVRSPASTIDVIETDFRDAAAIGRLASKTAALPIDIVLIAHGALPEQSLCENDLLVCRDALEVNAVSPALFAEAFAGHFAKAGRGTIAIIGSVAGDRGRKANYTYGACKGLVARYAEGLEHRFAGTGVRVVLIKPGPTDTPMAARHLASGRRLASVEDVARAMVRGIDAKRPVVYAPAQWALIMLVVRHLPRFIFNRLNL